MDITDFIKNNKELNIEQYNFLKGSFIYFICEPTGEIIYIGSTAFPQFRFRSHSEKIEFYDKPIYFFSCQIENCKELERKLIIKINPKYNIQYVVKKSGRVNGQQSGAEEKRKSAMRIRKQIKQIMANKKITRIVLAKKLGVSRQRVEQLINGNFGFHYLTIKKIETALECKLSALQKH